MSVLRPRPELDHTCSSPAVSPILEISDLVKHFGGVAAVNGVSFCVNAGEIVGLIGPNGSGKTTLFNCVTGILEPEPGSHVSLQGQEITRESSDKIARLGLTRTFQEVRVFHHLTVRENLLMAAQQYQEDDLLLRFFNGAGIRRLERQANERAREMLAFVGLSHHALTSAHELSYGQRKLLIFAMALMPSPAIILLDEPAAAVNPTAIEHIKGFIREANREGISFLIIEHNMDVIMDLCGRIVVLDNGERIAEGSPKAVQSNERVIDAYFGTE